VRIPFSMKKNNYLLWQYYKMKDCFDLLSDHYDEIIRLRPDITLQKFSSEPYKLTVSEYTWWNQRYDGYRINEMVFAGDYSTMKKACDVIDNIPAINILLPEVLLYGESIFYQHLRLEGLLDKLNFYDFGWRVLR